MSDSRENEVSDRLEREAAAIWDVVEQRDAARREIATLREALTAIELQTTERFIERITRAALAASPAAEEPREHADARIARVNEQWGKAAEEPRCPGYPNCSCSEWATETDPHDAFGPPEMMGG